MIVCIIITLKYLEKDLHRWCISSLEYFAHSQLDNFVTGQLEKLCEFVFIYLYIHIVVMNASEGADS